MAQCPLDLMAWYAIHLYLPLLYPFARQAVRWGPFIVLNDWQMLGTESSFRLGLFHLKSCRGRMRNFNDFPTYFFLPTPPQIFNFFLPPPTFYFADKPSPHPSHIFLFLLSIQSTPLGISNGIALACMLSVPASFHCLANGSSFRPYILYSRPAACRYTWILQASMHNAYMHNFLPFMAVQTMHS